MMKIACAALAASLIASAAALAVDAPRAKAPALTVGQCNSIYAGLLSLDTYQRTVKDGNADKVITDHYRLGGPLRFAIAEALGQLKPIFDASEKARLGIIAEVGKGQQIRQGSPDELKVSRGYAEVLAKPCMTGPLPRIAASDLNVGDGPGQNPIPPAVLTAILPLVDR